MTRQKALAVRENKVGDIVRVPKVDLFLKEFLANGGHVTDAAMTVFKLKNRSSAATIGSRYMRQAKDLGRVFLEKKGATYGKLLEIALEKAINSKNTEWWDRLMKIAGYEDFMSKGGGAVNVNILTAQNDKNDFKGFIEEGEIIEAEEPEPEEEDEIDPTIQAILDAKETENAEEQKD